MGNILNKETIKAYLLGRISEEKTLAGIEEALFFDDEFAASVELAEDEIINDYVLGNLTDEDRESAENFFFKNSERQFKLKLTTELKNKAAVAAAEKPAFFETLKAFFRQPAYVGAFAVLLFVAIGLAVFLSRSPEPSELAELRDIYKTDRPVETRISEFGHAPLNTTRGENEDKENKSKLRRIELSLQEAVEKNPTAENHRVLGIFHLTQRDFADAAGELERAWQLDDKNAKIANDLGSAYLEMARTARDDRKRLLGEALEKFRRATELDPNLLEALFNKSLCLQEIPLYNEAKESWNSYLEKDPNSDWAQEARKKLESLEELKKTSKTKEQVLEDFLNAFRGGESEREFAWKINLQTKEMLTEVWLPGQLTRRFLEAKRNKRQSEATESIDALNFIGERERTMNADFFVAELAEYYSNLNDAQIENLLKAKDSMKKGLTAVKAINYPEAVKFFEESAKLFSENGNVQEEKIAEYWVAQCKVRPGKLDESLADLKPLATYFEKKQYKWLHGQTIFWISQNYFFQTEFTKTIDLFEQSLKISEEIRDTYGAQKSIGGVITTFDKIGESKRSLKYVARMPDVKDLYFYSSTEVQRGNLFAADIFSRLRLFAAAESFCKENLSLAKDSLDRPDLINGAFERLAKIYTEEKRFDEALHFGEESKRRAQEKPESKLKTFILAKATLQIAEAKRHMQRYDEAVTDYDAAIGYYSQIPEIRLNDFVIHKGKLLCFQKLNKQDELETEIRTLLDSAEQYRSQILKDEERLAFFANEQLVYDVAVENALAKGDRLKAFELAESSKARSLLDFIAGQNSIADLEKQFPTVSKPLSASEIQARMPEHVQIVQFAVLREKTVAWILTKTEIKIAEVKISADDLQTKVSDYLKSLIGKAGKTEIERSARELYDLLVAPVASNLDPAKEICFIRDKSLHQLLFASLLSERGTFFLEDFRIFYSPSASVFVFASEKAKTLEKEDEHLLSVGNPAFDPEKNAGLADLPSAEDEARKIAKFYPQTKLALGAEATKTKFLAEMPRAEVIHFAGHYVANSDTPSYSRLLFSADGEESDLRSFEIAAMKLPRAKLIVLSACETGIEKFYEGEGAIGMARTFLAAGAPLVAASNWKVNSEATKELMIAFHRNRREGLSTAEALRRAQIKMLEDENGKFREPYFWAAFSIIGGSSNY